SATSATTTPSPVPAASAPLWAPALRWTAPSTAILWAPTPTAPPPSCRTAPWRSTAPPTPSVSCLSGDEELLRRHLGRRHRRQRHQHLVRLLRRSYRCDRLQQRRHGHGYVQRLVQRQQRPHLRL